MNQEQVDVLNITQQVIKHTLIAWLAAMPASAATAVAAALRAAAADTALDETARAMLADLHSGVAVLAQLRRPPGH